MDFQSKEIIGFYLIASVVGLNHLYNTSQRALKSMCKNRINVEVIESILGFYLLQNKDNRGLYW